MGASVRRSMVLTMGILGFMVVALGVAWGCTVQAGILSVSPDEPEPGDVLTVTGNEYHGNATIQLHWGGEAGPVIGETVADSSGTFSAEGTVPTSAEPGKHLLVAKDPDVSTPGHGEASVMVCVGGGCEESAGEASAGDQTADEASPEEEPAGQAAPSEPEPAEQAAPSASEGERQQIGGESPQAEGEPQQIGGEPQPAGGEPQPAGGERQQVGAAAPSAGEATAEPAPTASAEPADPAPAEAAPAQPGPEPAPAPAEESAEREGSVETSGPVSLGPDQVARGNAAAPEAAPSERSAGGDLWSGVAPSESPSLTPEAGYDSAAEAGQTGPGQFAVGLALFGAGLTVLLAGAGVPALRRRRALAQARATRSD